MHLTPELSGGKAQHSSWLATRGPPTQEVVAKVSFPGLEFLFGLPTPHGARVFCGDDPVEAGERASAAIAARSGHAREVFSIGLASLAEIVDRHGDAGHLRQYEFTLHGGGHLDPAAADVREEADRHRCEIVDSGPARAMISNRIDSEGHATLVLESLNGGPATFEGSLHSRD